MTDTQKADTLSDGCVVRCLTEVKVGILSTVHSSVWPSPGRSAENTFTQHLRWKTLVEAFIQVITGHAISERSEDCISRGGFCLSEVIQPDRLQQLRSEQRLKFQLKCLDVHFYAQVCVCTV